MQRDDGLAGAGRAGDSRRPGIAALDQLPLRRVEEDRPFLPRIVECALQLLEIGHDAEAALRVGMGEGIGARGRGDGGFERTRGDVIE
jgi:hypothetical protein